MSKNSYEHIIAHYIGIAHSKDQTVLGIIQQSKVIYISGLSYIQDKQNLPALYIIHDKQYSIVLYTWQAILSPCPVYRTSIISLSCIQDKQYLPVLYAGQATSPCPVYRTSNISLSCIQDKQYLPVLYTGQTIFPCPVYNRDKQFISLSCIQDMYNIPLSCIQDKQYLLVLYTRHVQYSLVL